MTDVIGILIKDEKIEIAIKLLKKGLSVEDIADSTGLDIEIIEELQNELEKENS